MIRQIVLILLVIAAIWLFRRLRRKALERRRPRARPLSFNETVRCKRCGVHILRHRAVADGDGWSCGDPACIQRQPPPDSGA